MASKRAVAVALAMLAEGRAATVTEATTNAWVMALDDITDAELGAAVRTYLRESEDRFMPPPAALRKLVLAARPRPVEEPRASAFEIVRTIERLAVSTPAGFVTWPRVESVRERFGDAVAHAYGYVGASRLFADSPTTRDIALRDFAVAYDRLPADARLTVPALLAASQPRAALPAPAPPSSRTFAGPQRLAGLIPPPPTPPTDA